jgi:uncharacterized protein (TIGR02466 family)
MKTFKEDSTVIGAFPVPILMENLNRSLTEEEFKFFEIQKKEKNIGNSSSDEHYVLEKKEMAQLKIDILQGINNYFNNIICPIKKITPFITQSWLNWTTKNEFHHKHNHGNSYISGVFYIDVIEGIDSINFFNEQYSTIYIENDPNKKNVFNTNVISINVKKGLLILFPSSLSHSVYIKNNENVRVSLAFNTFIKGTFGNNKGLTELTL